MRLPPSKIRAPKIRAPKLRAHLGRMGIVALLASCLPLSAEAAVSDTFALQGRLVSAGGFPVPDGDYGLTVSFYADANSTQALYTYLEPGVKVQKGLFVLAVGGKTKLDKAPFLSGGAAWFGVQVGSDPELPRLPLHQVPYAVRAQVALALQCTGCLTGDMLDASVLKDYAKSATLATVASSGTFSDLKGVPVLVAADQACPAGSTVAGLSTAGKLVCAGVPTYSGKDFALANQGCPAGAVVIGTDSGGKPVCTPGFAAGMIMMWSGSLTSLPVGWALCDGNGGAPDLRSRFIVGAGSTYAVGATGGTADAVVVSHTHKASVSDPGHAHSTTFYQNNGNTGSKPYGSLSSNGFNVATSTATTGIGVSISTEGTSGVGMNLPPYYALAYIIKL